MFLDMSIELYLDPLYTWIDMYLHVYLFLYLSVCACFVMFRWMYFTIPICLSNHISLSIDKWIPYYTSDCLSVCLYLCFDVLIMLMCVIRLEIIPLMSLILHIITHNSIGAKLLKRFNKDSLSRELMKNKLLMDGYLPLKNTRNVFRISKYVILKTYHSLSSC